MHHIYRKARGVYIWLGDGADGCEDAMEAIRDLTIPASAVSGTTEDIQKRIVNYRKDAEQLFDASLFKAIATLGRNAWFRRLWTAQEYFYGQTTSFFCGNVLVDGAQLLGAFRNITIYSFGPKEPASWTEEEDLFAGFRALLDLDKIKARHKGESSPSFFEFVNMGRKRFCKEPVDRVYALFGMAENTDEVYTTKIPIDYSEDARTHYWRVFNQFGTIAIQHEPHLALLSIAGSRERSGRIPSWCPDLAFPEDMRVIDPVNVYAAGWPWAKHGQEGEGQSCKGHAHFLGQDISHASISPDGDVLSIWGVSLGQITLLGPLKKWDSNGDSEDLSSVQSFARDLLDWFAASERFCRTHGHDESHARVLWGALLVGETNKIRRRRAVAADVDEVISAEADTERSDDRVYRFLVGILLRILDLDLAVEWEHQDSGLLQWFQTVSIWVFTIADDWEGRVLFATDKGYIGYAAETVKPQDTVCILYGGRPLYVLRTEGTGYHLISEAYGYQLVNGEVFELLDQDLVVEEQFSIS